MSFQLVIESKDLYTYHAVAWFIFKHKPEASALASVINARDPHPKVLQLARGYGYLESLDIWYQCDETADAYCTDTRPEPWRRITLKGYDSCVVRTFVEMALVAYKEHIATLRANDGLALYSWDDHDGWVSMGDAPKRSIDTLLLPGDAAKTLLEELKDFVSPHTRENYAALNIPMIKILMLHGVPGSGKTSLVRCLASELGFNVATYTGDDVHMFSDALMQAPAKCIVSVEDIDCMLGTGGNQREKKGFAHLLNAFDAVARKEPLIVCFTTNFPGGLDIAIRRRVDHCLEFKHATKAQVFKLVQRFFPNLDDVEKLWDIMTDSSTKKITMAMVQKFLVRSMKYYSPWTLLKEDPDAFQSLRDVVSESSSTHHMYM